MIAKSSNIFFTVIRSGKRQITVKEGCIFTFTGNGSSLVTNDYDNSSSAISLLPETEFPSKSPNEHFGTHTMVPQQSLTVNTSGKLFLLLNHSTPTVVWNLSIVDGTNSLLQNGIGIPAADWDTTVNAELLMKDRKFVLSGDFVYTITEGFVTDGILIANISYDSETSEITKIEQIHEGIIFLGRYQWADAPETIL